jgi:hypothetical protein
MCRLMPRGWRQWTVKQSTKIRECNQKFPDWPPGARTANGTALCYWVQLYRHFVSQSSEFCSHNLSCCFSTNVYFYSCCLFRYRLSPETFGYTLVLSFRFSFALHQIVLCHSYYVLRVNKKSNCLVARHEGSTRVVRWRNIPSLFARHVDEHVSFLTWSHSIVLLTDDVCNVDYL